MGNTAGEGICVPARFLLPLEPEMKKVTWNHENQENQKNQENQENQENHHDHENYKNHENHKNQKYTIIVTKS